MLKLQEHHVPPFKSKAYFFSAGCRGVCGVGSNWKRSDAGPKVRTLQDMEDSLWREPNDPALSAAIARVWDFADRIAERHYPPGVHKHRSIEAAQELRDRWEENNFRRFRASREPTQDTIG